MLVGGEGTRLRPLTYTIPKPLLPIANRPFLERQLAWLAAHGVDEVILSLGYLPDVFEAHYPEGRFGDLSLRYAVEHEPLGTAGAIRFAASGATDRFVVCNGDVLTTLDLGALVRFHDEHGADASIHLTRVDNPAAFGAVETGLDAEVLEFVEKPSPVDATTDWINAGTYVLDPVVLDEIPSDAEVSIERETFPAMLQRPGRLFAMTSDDYWRDIGTPVSYLAAHADVLAGALGLPPVPGAVEHTPGVWVQGEVDVGDAVLTPPLLLGAGVQLGSGAQIESSSIGPECVIEAAARVRGSVVLGGARLGARSETLDSVVGPEAVLEPDVAVTEESVIGASAVVTAGVQMSAARVHVPPRP